MKDAVQCPICGSVFLSGDMVYCGSCERMVCADNYNYEIDACVECSIDIE